MPLNVNTLGQIESDHINQIVTITYDFLNPLVNGKL